MSVPIAALSVEQLTSGAQLFRCVPYSCTMLARACVERQAKAALGLDAITLLKCKGCGLGAEVKARAGDVVLQESDLLRGARATGHHRNGELGKKLRGLKFNPATPVTPPALADAPVRPAPRPAATPQEVKERKTMPTIGEWQNKTVGGMVVLDRSTASGDHVIWHVRHLACGHEEDVAAPSLAYCEKNNSVRRCQACRAAGTLEPAREKAPKPKPVADAEPAKKAVKPPPPSARSSVAPQEHAFPLRRDFTVNVTLPSDLSPADIQRFSRWLDAIVFDDTAGAAE